MKQNTGARWEIAVDGVPRSYRDDRRLAIEGAEFLKRRNPNSEVAVRAYEGKEPPIVISAVPPQMRR
jgi:hypothetical protein